MQSVDTDVNDKNMPRTKEQCQKIKERRKEAIKAAGLRLFAINGYKSVTIDDVMDEVNSAHSLFYHYYPSKEELFRDIMHEIEAQMTSVFNGISYDKKAILIIEDLLDKLLKLISKKQSAYAIYLLLTLHYHHETFPQARETDHKIAFWDYTYKMIKKGQEEGDIPEGNIEEYTLALFSIIHGLAYKGMFDKNKHILPNKRIIMNLILKRKENE